MATEDVVLVTSEDSALSEIIRMLKHRIPANLDRSPIPEIKCLLLEEFDSGCLIEGDDGIR